MHSTREAIGLEGLVAAVVTVLVLVSMAKVILLWYLLLMSFLLVAGAEVEEEGVELQVLGDDLVELVLAFAAVRV